ncbi:MAG: glutathione S-transferase family protein [Parvularculaceae bacterium]
MYTLYYAPGAASLCIHWMLIELGVPFDTVAVDFAKKAQKDPEYLKLNPSGVVPTLIVDGAPRFETGALLLLLAERHPEAKLAPAAGEGAHADMLQWLFYFANQLQPAFRLWFYPEEAAGAHNVMASQAESRKRIEAVWDRVDAHLADGRAFMLGDTMSIVDFHATMLTRWSRNMPKPATAWPHIGAYVKRMRARPALIEVHKREGLKDWINN